MSIPHDKQLRALIWAAVSTPAQALDEKESIPAQIRDLTGIADNNQWAVAGILTVPGFSRDYLDIHEWIRDAAAESPPVLAPQKLVYDFMDYPRLQYPKFDVFLCRDADRFGRTRTLVTHIAEAILGRMNLLIYSQRDGLIDQQKMDWFISTAANRAAGEIETFKKRRHIGMNKNAERGLPTSSRITYSHRLIRDEKFKPIKQVFDQSQRRLWDDVAILLLEGVSWRQMESELWRRWRHGEGDKPFTNGFIRTVMHSATFWGHSARFYRSDKFQNGMRTDVWLYDESEPVPEGVLMYRNTHEAVYTGEQASKIIAEMRRRRKVVGNHPRPTVTRRFAGICICGECRYQMIYCQDKARVYMRCDCYANRGRYLGTCGQSRMIREEKIQKFVHALLLRIIARQSATDVLTPVTDTRRQEQENQLVAKDAAIAAVDERARRAIAKQISAPVEFADLYDAEIERLAQQLEILKSERAALAAQIPRETPEQVLTVADLETRGLDRFWQQSNIEINQELHRLFGNSRLVVSEGEIIDIAPGSGKRLPIRRIV